MRSAGQLHPLEPFIPICMQCPSAGHNFISFSSLLVQDMRILQRIMEALEFDGLAVLTHQLRLDELHPSARLIQPKTRVLAHHRRKDVKARILQH